MKRSLGLVVAVVLAGGTSLASAQISPYGTDLSGSAGLHAPPSLALSPFSIARQGGTGLGNTSPLLSPNGSSALSTPGFGHATPPSLGGYGSSALGYATPSPLNLGEVGPMTNTLSPTAHYPLVNCHPGGCLGADGTRYSRGAGNVMFGSNGKICHYMAPGAPLVCN